MTYLGTHVVPYVKQRYAFDHRMSVTHTGQDPAVAPKFSTNAQVL